MEEPLKSFFTYQGTPAYENVQVYRPKRRNISITA
jgi:hypothetical protein